MQVFGSQSIGKDWALPLLLLERSAPATGIPQGSGSRDASFSLRITRKIRTGQTIQLTFSSLMWVILFDRSETYVHLLRGGRKVTKPQKVNFCILFSSNTKEKTHPVIRTFVPEWIGFNFGPFVMQNHSTLPRMLPCQTKPDLHF